MITSCSTALFLLLPFAVISINIAPKTDFGDESTGINHGIIKTIIQKDLDPTVSPGVVKAVLEVNVAGLTPTSKPESKTDEKEKKKKKNQILVCTLDGKCKLHEIIFEDSDEEDGVKKIKPIIVTDFNVDPSKEKKNGHDDDKHEGKDIPDIPIIVGYKGAVRDEHSYYSGQMDRLPVYYGMKLSPAFHQYPPPGSIIYEEDTHHHPTSGPSAPRTPTPYGKFYPTSKPSYQGVITPLHRRAGGGDWTGSPGVYWSTRQANEVPKNSGSGWVGSNKPGWVASNSPGWGMPSTPGVVGSKRPGVYWPTEKTPAIVLCTIKWILIMLL
ncbi:hypothetical protein L9F63_026998 [Diploptera punctata]|uniref:Uncharacterized protein n=1 Tax=Diploptera punctata TaxID=6984 RepID=A0AAD8AG17_DIPPU|nr:hypothetical protein L9F63_026998 [Diploptera punctata]